jgi:hypothetical protein
LIPRAVIAVAVAALLAVGLTPVAATAADVRLDEALAALQKAEALLLSSQSGVVSKKQERQFERHVERALLLISLTMDQIEAAKEAVDNPPD